MLLIIVKQSIIAAIHKNLWFARFCSRFGRFYCRNHFVQWTAPKCEGCHQHFRHLEYLLFSKLQDMFIWSSKSRISMFWTEKPSLLFLAERESWVGFCWRKKNSRRRRMGKVIATILTAATSVERRVAKRKSFITSPASDVISAPRS